MAVFYSKVLLKENLWKMITTKYHFVNVRRHGHPLVLVEGGYVLHVVKLGSLLMKLLKNFKDRKALHASASPSQALPCCLLIQGICRCGDLYESFLLIEGKEGKMEHKRRSHNRVVRACKDFNKHQKFMLCLHRPRKSTSGIL
ncbi:hypothetical protein ACFX2H_036475 [Malus domestica]